MTLRELIQDIEEMNDETLMDREIKYYHKSLEGYEITVPINAIGISYTELLLAKECPECATQEIQECLNNIYKAEED